MYINKNTLVGNNQLFEGLPMLIDINNKNLNNNFEFFAFLYSFLRVFRAT